MKREVTARVFLEGANRAIKLAEPSTDKVIQMFLCAPEVTGVTVNGEQFAARSVRIVDVLGPVPDPLPEYTGTAFDGRRVEVRAYAAWRREEERLAVEHGVPVEEWPDYGPESVVVLAEDLAEAPVVVLDADGDIVWANPAVPRPDLYAQAAILLAQAERLTDEANSTGLTGETAAAKIAAAYEAVDKVDED